MAVSKTHPAETIAEGFAAGLRMFGENRVQEFQQKLPALNQFGVGVLGCSELHNKTAAVHLIGHLQSNKTARAAEIFSQTFRQESLLPFTLLRLGSLAVGRRVRTYYRLFRAEHGA